MTTLEVLSRLLPSLDEINQLLARIRKKHDIPEFLPDQIELAEAVWLDSSYDWDVIQQEAESGLRELLQHEFVGTGPQPSVERRHRHCIGKCPAALVDPYLETMDDLPGKSSAAKFSP